MIIRRMAVLPLLFAFTACPPAEPPVEEEVELPPVQDTFNPEEDLEDLTETDSGLQYKDLAAGDGDKAEAGKQVTVHYTGWLTDGSKFDSSRDRGEPITIPLGAGQVIPGMDEGLKGMKIGGHRRLVIPPNLAYGDQGAGDVIPPNATLVFNVQLLAIE